MDISTVKLKKPPFPKKPMAFRIDWKELCIKSDESPTKWREADSQQSHKRGKHSKVQKSLLHPVASFLFRFYKLFCTVSPFHAYHVGQIE